VVTKKKNAPPKEQKEGTVEKCENNNSNETQEKEPPLLWKSTQLLHWGNSVCQNLLDQIIWNEFEPQHLISKKKLTSIDQLQEYFYCGGDCTLRVHLLKCEFEGRGFHPSIAHTLDPKTNAPHVALWLDFDNPQTNAWADYPDSCFLFWDPGLHHPYGQILYKKAGPLQDRPTQSYVYGPKQMFLATFYEGKLSISSRPYANISGLIESTYDFGTVDLFEIMKGGKLQTTGKIENEKISMRISKTHVYIQDKLSNGSGIEYPIASFLDFLTKAPEQVDPLWGSKFTEYLVELLQDLIRENLCNTLIKEN